MSGAFLMSREIFNHDIWNDVPKFRIFFYVVGNAVFSEKGVTKGGIHIGRGQYLRSYRNIREDLLYIDNNAEKYYALSLIKKKVDSLVEDGMLTIEETRLGTLFTVVNYHKYQGFEHYKNEGSERQKNGERTAKEQPENSLRTEKEQPENNNNYVNKGIKGINDLPTTTTTSQPENGFAIVLQTFEANLCRLSPLQMDSLGKWFDDFNQQSEVMVEAIKIADNRNKRTFGFVEGLLKEWTNNKLKNLDQVQTYERNKFGKPKGVTQIGTHQPSNQRPNEQQSRIREANERRKRIAGIRSH